jgi:hypothetical protein
MKGGIPLQDFLLDQMASISQGQMDLMQSSSQLFLASLLLLP